MKYQFRCPLCGETLHADVDSGKDAVNRLADMARDHMKNAHSDQLAPPIEQMRENVRRGMRPE